MCIKNNKSELLILNNFVEINNINKIVNKFIDIKLLNKRSEKYSCMIYALNNEYLSFYGDIININKILNILKLHFASDFTFSSISEYIEMTKGDFLLEHTDGYHDYQAVLYLSNIDELIGGEFIIEDSLYNPSAGDLIIFKGNTKHSVNLIKSLNKRISISFGFNKIT